MQTVLKFLEGKKTIIASIVMFCAGGLLAVKVIDGKTYEIVMTIAGSLATYGVYDKLSRMSQ